MPDKSQDCFERTLQSIMQTSAGRTPTKNKLQSAKKMKISYPMPERRYKSNGRYDARVALKNSSRQVPQNSTSSNMYSRPGTQVLDANQDLSSKEMQEMIQYPWSTVNRYGDKTKTFDKFYHTRNSLAPKAAAHSPRTPNLNNTLPKRTPKNLELSTFQMNSIDSGRNIKNFNGSQTSKFVNKYFFQKF